MNYDIIIIGGGLGGLTAGAKLAKEGKKVLLLEQHDRPGGCATTFLRKDFIMEVGLHEMDGLHPGDMKTRIFRDLGVSERVEFLEVPEFYRFKNERHDIVVPHNPEKAASVLLENFPSEGEGIKTYFEHLLNARKIISSSDPALDRSVGEWLDEITGDDDLKLVLLGNLGYFHDDPYTLSYYYYITAQGSYYGGRANFIKGGSQELSNALSDIITENGGTVRLKKQVKSLIFREDRLFGVEYQDKGTVKTMESDEAAEVIVNSSLPEFARNIMPPGRSDALLEKIRSLETGASLLTVYYGFRKPLSAIGNRHYSTFIFDDPVRKPGDIVLNNRDDFSRRSFTFVDYSQVDSGLAPEGKSVAAACCIDYLNDWEGLTRSQYMDKKSEVAEVITGRLEKLIPGFSDAVEYVEVATAMTVKKYTLNTGGAVYGFAQVPHKSTNYLNYLPENIHIASAWGKFGGGFSGAIFSGYMTAMDILRKGRRQG